jgi:tetratricopeptide (TPR) repeat protein
VYSRQAIEVAETLDAKPILVASYHNISQVYAITGRLDAARQALDQALTFSRAAGNVRHLSFTLLLAGLLRNWEGAYTEASHRLSDSLRLARENNLMLEISLGHFIYGITLTGKGDFDQALTTLEAGLALTEKVGDEYQRPKILNSLGWLYSECGNLDRALDLNRQGAEMARKLGYPEPIANAELNLGDIFLAQGDLALAREFLDGVDRLTHDPATSDWMKWRYSTHLFASLGDLWLARGDPARAQGFAEQCLEIATRTNSRKYMVKGWRLKGDIAFAHRQWDEAEHWLRQALQLAQTVGNPTQLWKTHLAIGRLHTEVKRPEQVRQAYSAACEVIDRVKAHLQNPELRASLDHSSLIQQVYAEGRA